VEVWLQNVVDAMRAALSAEFKAALPAYEERPRARWIFENSVQNTVVVSRAFFTREVNAAFAELEEGNEHALKVCLFWIACCSQQQQQSPGAEACPAMPQEVYERQVAQLVDLIELINGELTKNERKKLITLCTIDVHARDVVQRLIDERVESGAAFQWQSQLRYSQHDRTRECQVFSVFCPACMHLVRPAAEHMPRAQVNICDAEIRYNYEYIGNCGCLCITPLTDRCYITLTQAQRLILGGAPAGPAGLLLLPACMQERLLSLPPLTQPRCAQARARRRRPRTWRARWACSATCSTAATRWTTRPWARSTRASRRRAPGAALTSSTASPSPCCPSAPPSTRWVLGVGGGVLASTL
jgi:hypothetical protein